MAYFNHAFQKLLLGTKTTGATDPDGWYIGPQGAITTGQIPSGVIAAVAATNGNGTIAANTVLDGNAAVPSIAACPQIYLAQGSINTKDKLGPFAGGYKESVKTKGINPRYVTKFYKQLPINPQEEIVNVCLCEGAEAQCGTSYYLRIDVKGSPALRFLTHNAYRTYASNNICCPADPTASTAVDSMQIIADWAWQISRDPIMNNFILANPTWDAGASYYDAAGWFDANPTADPSAMFADMQNAESDFLTGTAYDPESSTGPFCLKLTGAYVDTQFGTCSFHPQDFYELAPVKIYPSMTDQQGDPCVDQVWCTSYEEYAAQGSGYGFRYVRDLILFRRYMQEQYVYDPRLREVMDQDVITNSNLVQSNQYVEYGILHSVPRFNNPTSTFDNDQYLITIVMPAASSTFEAWMGAYIALGGNGVTLETL